MKNVGERLKYFRQKLGLSQLALSQKSSVSQASIARIEAHQQKNLGTKTIEKLTDALGISLSKLMEEPLMVKEDVSPYANPEMIPVVTLDKFMTSKSLDKLKENADRFEPSLSHDRNSVFIKATGLLTSRPFINEGDLLLIEPYAKVKDGDIVLYISKDHHGIGRIFYRPSIIILHPLKPEAEPVTFSKKEETKYDVKFYRIGEMRRKYSVPS